MPTTRYVDHGAYFGTNISFTVPSISTASGAMSGVVLDPGSDPIGLYALIESEYADPRTYIATLNASGNPANHLVSANWLQSRSGGISIKAKGAIYRDPIVWGQPLEGDGLGSNRAMSAAQVSINLTGVTAAAGATLTLAGAELVCNAANGINQFSPASGAALVTALVAAINRSTNTAVVVPHVAGWYAHKPQDVFFARADPNNAAILQIMCRAGSALHNNTPTFAVARSTAGWTGLATGPFLFSGGQSGAWGYAWGNGTAAFSSITAWTYGAFGSTQPLAGTVDPGDTIVCRAHSRWLGYSAYMYNNPNSTIVAWFSGTQDAPIVVTNDDGTVWPEDAANGNEPVFKVGATSNSASSAVEFGNQSGAFNHWVGKLYPSGKRGLAFHNYGTSLVNSARMSMRVGNCGLLENADLIGEGEATIAISFVVALTNARRWQGRNVRVSWEKQKSVSMLAINSSSNYSGDFDNCVFELRNADAPQTGYFGSFNRISSEQKFVFRGCKFVGFRAGSRLLATFNASALSASTTWLFENCDFGEASLAGGITDFGPNFREWQTVRESYAFGNAGLFITSAYGKSTTVMDTPYGFIGWSVNQDYPCLNARLMDNSSWVYRVVPTRFANQIGVGNPMQLPAIPKEVTAATGVKKLVLNLLLEKSMAWNQRDVGFVATYVDNTGTVRNETTIYSLTTPIPALQPPPAPNVWTKPLGSSSMAIDPADGVERATYNDSGVPLYFNQYQITLRTRYPVASGSIVQVQPRITRSTDFDTQQLFVDPDVQIENVVA